MKKPAERPLAERLNAERERQELSWPEFAQLLGEQNEHTIYKIATGRTRNPHKVTQVKLARRLADLEAKPPVKQQQQKTA